MKKGIGLVFAVAFAFALSAFPAMGYAVNVSDGGGLTAGGIASPSIKTQSFDRVDGGTIGTCDWDIYNSDGDWILFISPSNGDYGYLDDIYYDEDTDGSTAPWYSYSEYIDGISIASGYVLAGDSCNCMFCDCPNLKWANLSDLDTSLTTNMTDMFFGDSELSIIYVKTLWDTSKVTDSTNMFYGCISLQGGNGTEFNSDYCDDLYANIDYAVNPGYLTSLWMGDAEIYLDSTYYTYDSNSKTPGVTVYIGTYRLDPSDEYSVSYSNNVNAGTAYVTVYGEGIYGGEQTESFTIDPADISSLTLARSSMPYNGKIQKPGVGIVKADSISVGSDGYSVSYANANSKAVGTYKVTVTGKGNYAGSATATYKITPADISKAAVALSKTSAAYTGKAQKGTVKSVKLGSTTLKSGTDYTVSAKSGKAVGSYVVTVTGKGNYKGSAKATFKVKQAANKATAKKTSVKKTLKSTALKKKAQTVALPKVTAKFGTAKWKVSAKDKKGVLKLKSGKIQVKKGAKKGTYTIKLKASVAKTKNYKAATTKVVTVKVTVK